MRRFFVPTGSVGRITVGGHALENNMLGDPSVRAVDIYLPAGHDGRDLPLLVDLAAYRASDQMATGKRSIPLRITT